MHPVQGSQVTSETNVKNQNLENPEQQNHHVRDVWNSSQINPYEGDLSPNVKTTSFPDGSKIVVWGLGDTKLYTENGMVFDI